MADVVNVDDATLASSLRTSVMHLARRLRGQRSDASLTLPELSALATLEHRGPMTPTELALREKVRPPSITRVLAALSQQGLVTRHAHPSDGRQALVAITEAGLALIKVDRARRDAWLSRRFGELEPDELQSLRAAASVLEKLANASEPNGRVPAQGTG
ncbi:MAG: MarR family transcriptional regulator [Acidimicrobiales bacterium]|nr:MarR family transcriptional regulator [Acidimicrobiales bacterium]MBO0885897.1 MarR family transcriptional regulator [Acidimicrobiales bacterium]MBO0892909.1 MarR family transcriptional regulator [Acidimicrobiales bacterium]